MHIVRSRLARLVLVSALVIAGLGLVPSSAPAAAPPGLDHFTCYAAKSVSAAAAPPFLLNPLIVTLTDEFGTSPVIVAKQPNRLCNPVEKTVTGPVGTPPVVTPITNPAAHLVCWAITRPPTLPAPAFNVVATNQFGDAALTTKKATELCVPSWKFLTPPTPPPTTDTPPGLDHFECYSAAYTTDASGKMVNTFEAKPKTVGLSDEFGVTQATVIAPTEVCNPVQKVLPTGQVFTPQNPAAHLVCFAIRQVPVTPAVTVFVQNQFGKGTMVTAAGNKLCLPSFKDIVTGPAAP